MKELKACCGFGHRIIHQNITEKVNRAVFEACTLGCKVFYTGAMGEFDSIFTSSVLTAKNNFPEIKLICVKPYLTKDIIINNSYINSIYDDIIVPTQLADIHYKSVITKRNQIMIDKSDIVIIYNVRNYGGAYQSLIYAEKTNKSIIRI